MEEVKSTLFDTKLNKYLGPDEMTPSFYQQYWDTMGGDIVRYCDDFIQNDSWNSNLNRTHIVLIPKTNKPNTMGDLRPIALCNVL